MELDESDWRPEEAQNDRRWHGTPSVVYALAMLAAIGAVVFAFFQAVRGLVMYMLGAFS